MNFHIGLSKEKHVERRRNLASGILFITIHDSSILSDDGERKNQIYHLARLLKNELDSCVYCSILKIMHSLCLKPEDSCHINEPILNYDLLSDATPLNDKFTPLLLPFLIEQCSNLSHQHLQSEDILTHLCLLLITLSHGSVTTMKEAEMSSMKEAEMSSMWDTIKIWVVETMKKERLSLPLLYLYNALNIKCVGLVTSIAIRYHHSRILLSQFLRNIISCNHNFYQQWNHMMLFFLFTYCTDDDNNSKQCLNILFSRPGIGLKTIITLLLSNSIEVDYELWKKIKNQVTKNQKDEHAIHFNAISKGNQVISIFIRYGNTKQSNMINSLLLKALEVSILMYMNKIDFSNGFSGNSGSTVSNISSVRNGGSITLSVLTGVQALLRASVNDHKQSKGAEIVLLRLARFSKSLAHHILKQLQEIHYEKGDPNFKRKKDLIQILVEEVQEMEDGEISLCRQQYIPCRPKGGRVKRPFTAVISTRRSSGRYQALLHAGGC